MRRLPRDSLRSTGINEATPLLHDDASAVNADLYAISGACLYPDEPIYEPKTDNEIIVETLFSAWLHFPPRITNVLELTVSAFLCPKSLDAVSTAWKQIIAEKNSLPDSKVIVRGLAKCMVNYMYQLEIMVSDDVEEFNKAFTERVEKIIGKCWQKILKKTIKDTKVTPVKRVEKQQKIREHLRKKIAHVNLRYKLNKEIETMVQALFSAWLQFPPSLEAMHEDPDSAFLCPEAMNAMFESWKQIIAGKEFIPVPSVIVQGLVTSMVNHMYRSELRTPESIEEIKIVTERVENIVARCWQQILDETEKEEVREIAAKKRERRRLIRERHRRQMEIAYVNWFYEPFAKIDHDGTVDCRIVCILLCLCCSKFMMQVIICTILLAWPISIGTMGGMYMKLCPMSFLMPYAMIAAGIAGTLAILPRMFFAMYENISGEEITVWWPTILLKILEFVFFVFIIIQLYCFFIKTPSFDHGSPNYCHETFYKFVHWINYVSITVSSLWLIVYFIKGILTLHLRRFTLRPW